MPKLQFKDGRYYFLRKWPDRRGYQWIGLSLDAEERRRQVHLLETGQDIDAQVPPATWLESVTALVHRRVRERAKAADLYCDLTKEDIRAMGNRQNWRCAVTGLGFSRDRTENARARAFAPSVDRINCSRGYTKDNCRLVCVAVNVALNEWGELVFAKIARAYCRRHPIDKKPERFETSLSLGTNLKPQEITL